MIVRPRWWVREENTCFGLVPTRTVVSTSLYNTLSITGILIIRACSTRHSFVVVTYDIILNFSWGTVTQIASLLCDWHQELNKITVKNNKSIFFINRQLSNLFREKIEVKIFSLIDFLLENVKGFLILLKQYSFALFNRNFCFEKVKEL